MATTTSQRRSSPPYGADERGNGWIVFAGTMLMLLGVLNFIYGIAAISSSKFYAQDAKYVISDLKTWGWFLVIVGAIQFFAAFSIWNRTSWGRWVGIATASVNALLQLLVVSGSPFLSLALFSLDILVIYGLCAYGGRPRAA